MAQQPTDDLVAEFLEQARAEDRFAAASYSIATSAYNRWCRYLLTEHGIDDVCKATRRQCLGYLAWRRESVGGTTVLKDYQWLVWFYRWLVERDYIDAHPRAPRKNNAGPWSDNVTAPKASDPDPAHTRALTDDEYRRLIATCGNRQTLTDARDAALMSFLWYSGVRGIEASRADRGRVELRGDNPRAFVLGKGRTLWWRPVPLHDETAGFLRRYLRMLDKLTGGEPDPDAPLFVSTFNGSRASRESPRLTPNGMLQMLRRRCRAAGLDVPVTVHMFRRGMAVDAMSRGLGEQHIMHIAGWSDPRMLARYTKSAADDLAASAFRAAHAEPAPTYRRGRRGLRAAS